MKSHYINRVKKQAGYWVEPYSIFSAFTAILTIALACVGAYLASAAPSVVTLSCVAVNFACVAFNISRLPLVFVVRSGCRVTLWKAYN